MQALLFCHLDPWGNQSLQRSASTPRPLSHCVAETRLSWSLSDIEGHASNCSIILPPGLADASAPFDSLFPFTNEIKLIDQNSLHKHQGSSKPSSRGHVRAPVPVWLKCWVAEISAASFSPEDTLFMSRGYGQPCGSGKDRRVSWVWTLLPCVLGWPLCWLAGLCPKTPAKARTGSWGWNASLCSTRVFPNSGRYESSRFRNEKLEFPEIVRNSWNHVISYLFLNFIYMLLNNNDDHNSKLFP